MFNKKAVDKKRLSEKFPGKTYKTSEVSVTMAKKGGCPVGTYRFEAYGKVGFVEGYISTCKTIKKHK